MLFLLNLLKLTSLALLHRFTSFFVKVQFYWRFSDYHPFLAPLCASASLCWCLFRLRIIELVIKLVVTIFLSASNWTETILQVSGSKMWSVLHFMMTAPFIVILTQRYHELVKGSLSIIRVRIKLIGTIVGLLTLLFFRWRATNFRHYLTNCILDRLFLLIKQSLLHFVECSSRH